MQPVILDTNVLMSAAILPSSRSAMAFRCAVERFQLVHSDDTWLELGEVLSRKKFDRYFEGDRRHAFLLSIARVSLPVSPTVVVQDCEDPKDNKFLELALSAPASLIVSGDADLLTMHPYRGISILNVSDFLTLCKVTAS